MASRIELNALLPIRRAATSPRCLSPPPQAPQAAGVVARRTSARSSPTAGPVLAVQSQRAPARKICDARPTLAA